MAGSRVRELLFLLIWVGFFALPAPAQDQLGIYFDAAGTQSTVTTSQPYQQVTAYLILKNPTFADGLRSWECVVEARNSGNPAILNWQLAGGALNVATEPSFLVGLNQLLPSTADVLLATATIYVPDPGQETAFYIHPFDPPSLTDPPLWGYPVFAPAYGHGIEGDLAAAGWSSGCEASPVAVINDDGIAAAWDLTGLPETLEFGYLEVGDSADLRVVAVHAGEAPFSGTVSVTGGVFRYRNGDGYYTDQPTSFRLEPGQERDFLVRCAPEDSLVYEGQLVFQVCDRTFAVDLVGGYVEGTCVVPFASHDYGLVPVGGEVRRGFLVGNTGGGLLTIDPVIDSEAYTASLSGSATFPLILSAGQMGYVYVTFAPLADGDFPAIMDLGTGACREVQLMGQGSSTIPPQCDLNLTAHDFGGVAVGLQVYEMVIITNTGGNLLPVDLALEQDSTAFTLNKEPGLYELGPGQELQVGVTFRPDALAEFSAVLTTGSSCEDILFSGVGREPQESYIVPPELDLSSTVPGATSFSALSLRNNGETVVSGDLQIEGDETITLNSPGPFSISPGTQMHVYVRFSPPSSGFFSATISTGLPGGETVAVEGYGVPELPGEHNILGLYFDPDWTQNATWTYEPNAVVTGYLVLRDPSAAAGVAGWEMCLDCYPQLQILNWDIEGSSLPDFPGWCARVRLDAPLPPAADILLATLEVKVPLPIQNNLYLRPYGGDSLPDFAAYIDAADGVTLIPMATANPPYLAIFNPGMVASQIPLAPAAVAAGGQVKLTWECVDGAEGYHVYRRLGQTEPRRLTTVPVACSTGQASFDDQPGLTTGTVVHYSTTAVVGGQETARSVETEFVVTGGLPRAARLRPCYPNPFNPETRIPFDLDRAGPVRLAVYDIAGRLVRVIVDEALPAGNQERVWNGRDQAGRQVPSGTYYFRLEAGSGVSLQKAMLLK